MINIVIVAYGGQPACLLETSNGIKKKWWKNVVVGPQGSRKFGLNWLIDKLGLYETWDKLSLPKMRNNLDYCWGCWIQKGWISPIMISVLRGLVFISVERRRPLQ